MPSILNTNSVYWSPVTTYFELIATITQSTANNTSSIAYQLITRQTPNGSGYQRSINSCTVTINGTSNTAVAASKVSNGTVLQTGTVAVAHNNDGTKTVAISVNVNVGGSTASGSTNYTLDTIPRASALSVASDNIVISSTTSTSGTVSYTITPKTSYYHKLDLVHGTTTTTITIGQKSEAYTSTVTYTQLLSTVKTSTNSSVVFRLNTYSDSGYSTLIGSSSVVVPITITLKPSVTIDTLTADNSGMRTALGNSYFVAGYSKANIPFTATNTSGSTAITAYASVNKGSLTANSVTGTSGTFTTGALPASSTNYTDFTVSMYVVDSRGAQSDTVTKTIATVYGYTPPVIDLDAYRTLTDSSTVEDFTGNYVYVTWPTPTITSINSQNSIPSGGITCSYTGSTTGTVASSGSYFDLADGEHVSITLTVADKITSSSITVDVGVVAMPLDLYQDIVNNEVKVGVAFGGEARPNAITNYLATNNIFPYATCTTTNSTQAKVATTLGGDFQLKAGAVVIIKFTNGQTYNGAATLNVDGTGAHTICGYGTTTTSRYYWGPGAVRTFVFDGTNYVLEHGYYATTTYYGPTKLVNSVTSTSNAYAATPNSVKTAYDLANTANTAATTSTTTDSVITRTSGATLNSSSAIRQGKVVTVTLSVTGSGSLASGSDLFAGTISTDYYPPHNMSAITYYSKHIAIGVLRPDGTTTVRWITTDGSASAGVGTTFNFSWTFVQS